MIEIDNSAEGVAAFTQGQTATIDVRLRTTDGNPYDFTGVDWIRACFITRTGGSLVKTYVPITGTTASSSDLISDIEDTTQILEGQPISGTGIPSGATVLKTPASATNPTATGVIKISANCTISDTDVAIVVGSITITTPALWGNCRVPLKTDDTDVIQMPSFEVTVSKNDVTSRKVFKNGLDITDKVC